MSTNSSLDGLPFLVRFDASLGNGNYLTLSGGVDAWKISLCFLFVDLASDETCTHIGLDMVALVAHHPAWPNKHMILDTKHCSLVLNASYMIVEVIKFVNGGIGNQGRIK